MPLNPLMRLAPLVFALMTASCVVSPAFEVAPPRLSLPTAAAEPCAIQLLPESATLADLETGYAARGTQIAACDAARRLAVETLLAERALQDRWRKEQAEPRRWMTRQIPPGARH